MKTVVALAAALAFPPLAGARPLDRSRASTPPRLPATPEPQWVIVDGWVLKRSDLESTHAG